MRDAHSVITEAVNGRTKQLADQYEVSVPRMYEMLGEQCVYPKAKKLIRMIARINPLGVGLIKADMDSLFSEICDEDCIELADLTRELFEGGQAVISNAPKADQIRELREGMAAAAKKIAEIERDIRNERKQRADQVVRGRFATNGNGRAR